MVQRRSCGLCLGHRGPAFLVPITSFQKSTFCAHGTGNVCLTVSVAPSSRRCVQIPCARNRRRARRRVIPRASAIPADTSSAVHVLGNEGSSTSKEPHPVQRFALMAASLSRPALFRAIVAVSICVACGLTIPIMLGRTVSSLVLASQAPGKEAARTFYRALVKVVLLFLTECIAARFYVANMVYLTDVAISNLRIDTYGSISNGVDASFFDDVTVPLTTNAIGNDAARVRDLVWGSLQRDRGVRAICDMTLGSILVLRISPILASVYFVTVPVVAALSAFNGMRMARLQGEEAQARLRTTSLASEALSSWKTVLSFGTEMRELGKFRTYQAQVDTNFSSRLRGCKALQEFLARFSIVIVFSSFLCVGGGLVALGAIPLQTYLSANSFVWTMTFAAQGVIYSFSDGSEATQTLRRIYDVIDRADRASLELRGSPRQDVETLPKVQGNFKLDDVTFAYPSRPDVNVLSSLFLDIPAGKTTALVGLSGSGKSTIAALISRFYAPASGTIFLDGVDISSLDRSWFSEQIGFVSQHPVLFSGTVRDAIAYGAPDRRQPVATSVIEAAAKMANAYDFIAELPGGFDTEVGERGGNFSGGQLQRIAIARAIVRESRVLVLDEATSALDSESESKVQEALDRLTKNKTCLVIAHRLSTIRNAAKIVVLGAGGRVLETGNYDELIQRDGAFSRLMNTQTVVIGE